MRNDWLFAILLLAAVPAQPRATEIGKCGGCKFNEASAYVTFDVGPGDYVYENDPDGLSHRLVCFSRSSANQMDNKWRSCDYDIQKLVSQSNQRCAIHSLLCAAGQHVGSAQINVQSSAGQCEA